MPLSIKQERSCRWDLLSLGEAMLRFDPGEYRRRTIFARRLAGRRFRDRGFAGNRCLHSVPGKLPNLRSFFSYSLLLLEKIGILCKKDS